MNGSYLIQTIFLWVIHVERVASFVLLGIGGFALAVRLVALRLMTPGPLESAPAWLRGARGLFLFLVSLGVASVTAFLAIRPDAFFMNHMGADAVARKDAAGVITYYEPLARWSLEGPDVDRSLAVAYFEKHRLRDGIAVLHRALAVSPTLNDHTMCGRAHLVLGEVAQARAHVEAARTFAAGPEGQAAVEWLSKATAQRLPPPVPGAATAPMDPTSSSASTPR